MTPLPDKAEKSRNLMVDRPDDDSGDHGWRFFPTMPLRVVPPPPPPRRAWNVAGFFFWSAIAEWGHGSGRGGLTRRGEASARIIFAINAGRAVNARFHLRLSAIAREYDVESAKDWPTGFVICEGPIDQNVYQ